MKAPRVNKKRCVGCMACIDECPFNCITFNSKTNSAFIDINRCKKCRVCVDVCPVKAIK